MPQEWEVHLMKCTAVQVTRLGKCWTKDCKTHKWLEQAMIDDEIKCNNPPEKVFKVEKHTHFEHLYDEKKHH